MLKLRRQGSLLLNVLIGSAIMGILMMALTSWLRSGFKASARLSNNIEFSILKSSIIQVLNNTRACNGLFKLGDGTTNVTLNVGSLPLDVPILKANSEDASGGAVLIDISKPNIGSGVKLTKMQITSASPTGSTTASGTAYNRYLATLHIEAQRSAGSGMSDILTQDFLMSVLVNGTSKAVEKCENSAPNVLSFDLGDNGSSWLCINDVDLKDYCSDANGCTLSVRLYNKGYYDYSSWAVYPLYFEQPSMSQNDSLGISGSSGNNTYSSLWFVTGTSTRYTFADPWTVFYMLNYNHAYCPGSGGVYGPGLPAFHFSFLLHPSFKAHWTISKNLY